MLNTNFFIGLFLCRYSKIHQLLYKFRSMWQIRLLDQRGSEPSSSRYRQKASQYLGKPNRKGWYISLWTTGRSPGLVVMGEDSCSTCCEFESHHCILDGHFSHLSDVKIVLFVLKRPKINKKEARVGPFFYKKTSMEYCIILVQAWAGLS